MNTTAKKRGRRRVPYHCEWNDTYVHGLLQVKGSNRWRITDGPLAGREYRENDSREAVRRYYELTQANRPSVAIPADGSRTLEAIGRATEEAFAAGADEVELPAELLNQDQADQAGFFAQMRKMILEQPKLCARETGIEWLAWHEHQEPKPSPKLTDVIEHYAKKPGLSHDEVVRARKFWIQFGKAAGAETLKDVTHEAVAKYETKMQGEGLSPKSIKHRYTKVKTIVAHAMKRGMDNQACRAALDVLAMLEVPDATPLAPHPISIDDFWTIRAKAVEAGDAQFAAMMLTAANCCMYSGEVAALKWDEVNLKTGEVVTARPKTGVARVAVLWTETIAALKALPRERDYVFFSERRSYTTNLVSRHFADYRDQAKLPETVKFGDIRDAAYTYACRAVTLDKAKILAGHRLSGSTDHYVARNPQFVAPACAAIREAFEVEKHVKG